MPVVGVLVDLCGGLLLESLPIGALVNTLHGGLSSPVVGMMVDLHGGLSLESSPVGTLVNTPHGGSLLQSSPIGTLVDLHGDLLLEPSPVGTLVNSPHGGLLSQMLPVGTLVDLHVGVLMELLGIGSLLESLGIGVRLRLLGIGTLVELHEGVLAKLRMEGIRLAPHPAMPTGDILGKTRTTSSQSAQLTNPAPRPHNLVAFWIRVSLSHMMTGLKYSPWLRKKKAQGRRKPQACFDALAVVAMLKLFPGALAVVVMVTAALDSAAGRGRQWQRNHTGLPRKKRRAPMRA